MHFKKILPKSLLIMFLAILILPLSVGAKSDISMRAAKGDGCKTFSTIKSDICASGLVCEVVNFTDSRFTDKTSDCSNAAGNAATSGACDGVCISVSEQGFGLDASNFGRAGLSQSKDLKGTIARIINIALGFLGIIAVIFILMGGFKIMTAAGNEDQTGEGKKAIVGGVIGLVIIFAAWGISSFVISSLQSATSGGGGTASENLDGGDPGDAPATSGACLHDTNSGCDNATFSNEYTCELTSSQDACNALGASSCFPHNWYQGRSCDY